MSIAILTGDIINSKHLHFDWKSGLKRILSSLGDQPASWEIFRGDEFQAEVEPQDSLMLAIKIKAFLRAHKADARMSIGIGTKTTDYTRLSENNGSAFVRSGETFELLKPNKVTLAITTGSSEVDRELNLMLRLALTIMDKWLVQPAQFAVLALDNPSWQQEELGRTLGISQAAVSRRRKRAHFDLIMELDSYFRDKINLLP